MPACRPPRERCVLGLRRKKKDEEEIDPEQLRKDMERLEMIKAKRCAWQQYRAADAEHGT